MIDIDHDDHSIIYEPVTDDAIDGDHDSGRRVIMIMSTVRTIYEYTAMANLGLTIIYKIDTAIYILKYPS